MTYMAKANENTSDNDSGLSDEQWIVSQANLHRNSDVHAAKSWLIVGRTLFSRNFQIQVLMFVFMTNISNSSIGDIYCSRIIVVLSCTFLMGSSVADGQRAGLRRSRGWVQIAAATLSGNSLRQTVYTRRASVHQAAKLVAALLRVVRVTAGLAESNGSLLPGL